MSDLKYKTPSELRALIAHGESARNKLMAQALFHENEADKHSNLAKSYRKDYHNRGQRIAWARTWLARKETGQCN